MSLYNNPYSNPSQPPEAGPPPAGYPPSPGPGAGFSGQPGGPPALSGAGPGLPDHQPGPAIANLCFIVALIAFVIINIIAEIGKWGFALSALSGQLTLAGVAILFCLVGRYNFRETFSLRPLNPFTLFLCVIAGLAGQFAVRFPDALNQWIMSVFGPFSIEELIQIPTDTFGRILFFIMAVGAAPLCEEFLNRGFILSGYRRLGFGKTILFVGLLFGIFHLYPFRFSYTFLLGMALAYVVLVTRSIFSAMAMHFGFNLIGGFAPWITDWAKQVSGTDANDLLEGSSRINFETVIATIPISLAAAALFLVMLRSITRRMARHRPELELGYFGLARNIGPADASGGRSEASGPYYGPDPRFEYGRYGYRPASGPLAPPASTGTYPPALAPGMPTGNGNWPGWNPPPPSTTAARLSPLARTWWLLSFLLIFLLYGLTSVTEIAQRIANQSKPAPVPRPPAIIVDAPRSEVQVVYLK